MKICVTQRDGIRYFSKFENVAERDKLEVEVRIEDKDKVVKIDLTSALIEEYTNRPELGKIRIASEEEPAAVRPRVPLKIRQAKEVSPVYLSESQKQKEEVLGQIREAQMKLLEERKQKEAVQAAARAKRLAAARKIKAEKEEEARNAAAKKPAAKAKATATAPVQSKSKAKAVETVPVPAAKAVRGTKTAKATENPEKLTKSQKDAIAKIGKTLATEDTAKRKTKAKAVVEESKVVKATKPAAKTTKSAKPEPVAVAAKVTTKATKTAKAPQKPAAKAVKPEAVEKKTAKTAPPAPVEVKSETMVRKTATKAEPAPAKVSAKSKKPTEEKPVEVAPKASKTRQPSAEVVPEPKPVKPTRKSAKKELVGAGNSLPGLGI